MRLPKVFYSKLFLGAVLVVLLGVFGLELQQWYQGHKINSEINHLRDEKADLEARNNALQQSLQYFSSDSYKEKLAREQLGLKKEGEIVLNYPPDGIINPGEQKPTTKQSNPQKWWEFLFKNNKS